MTDAEFKSLLTYKQDDLKNLGPHVLEETLEIDNLPKTIDWRTKGAVNPMQS